MVRKPLVAESDLRRLHEDLPNILNLVKQGFPRRSVVDVDPGSDVPAEPDKAWCFPKFHMFQHLIPDNFLTFGQLDNTSAEAFETAHKYHVKDSWKGTNRKGAEHQVMARANRERELEFMAQEEARFCESNPDDAFAKDWPMLPTWRSTEKESELERRRGKESFFFPINEAATKEYRKHAVYSYTSGSRHGRGRPRCDIPLRVLNTGDPYTRDNPGLKYLNQSLVVFIINFHAKRLRLTQVLSTINVDFPQLCSCFPHLWKRYP